MWKYCEARLCLTKMVNIVKGWKLLGYKLLHNREWKAKGVAMKGPCLEEEQILG
jgi:hypothetical protein